MLLAGLKRSHDLVQSIPLPTPFFLVHVFALLAAVLPACLVVGSADLAASDGLMGNHPNLIKWLIAAAFLLWLWPVLLQWTWQARHLPSYLTDRDLPAC